MEAPQLNYLGRVSLNTWLLNLAAIPLALICGFGLILFAHALPHHRDQSFRALYLFLPAIVVAFSLHELTHALAARWQCGLSWKSFKFGFNPKAFILYCHCRERLTVGVYRTVALAPLLGLGPLSLLLVLVYPADWLALTAGIHISGCIGDVWIYMRMRKYAANVLVVDHPTDAGCDLYSPVPETDNVKGTLGK